MPSTKKPAESIQWVKVSAISRDQNVNTRPVDTAWVERKLREGFDPSSLGVPTVSNRGRGVYIWLDGQHRGELMRRSGWGDQQVECKVFTGLTTPQEAELFLRLNDSRQPKSMAKFLARVTAQEPNAVAITHIIGTHGWQIADSGAQRSVKAVASLDRVYISRKNDVPDGVILDIAMRVITEAWGHAAEAADGRIIEAVGLLFSRYDDQIDRAAFVKKLTAFPGGPSGLIGKGRGRNQYQGGTVPQCIAEEIHAVYNARRRVGALPDWK